MCLTNTSAIAWTALKPRSEYFFRLIEFKRSDVGDRGGSWRSGYPRETYRVAVAGWVRTLVGCRIGDAFIDHRAVSVQGMRSRRAAVVGQRLEQRTFAEDGIRRQAAAWCANQIVAARGGSAAGDRDVGLRRRRAIGERERR